MAKKCSVQIWEGIGVTSQKNNGKADYLTSVI